MKRRRLALVAGLALLLLLAGVAALLLSGSRDPVSLANYRRLHKGMALAEVEGVLGGPGERARRVEQLAGTGPMYVWEGERLRIVVFVDDGGRVIDRGFEWVRQPTVLERLRGWLGLD